jgi:hypothetical protein
MIVASHQPDLLPYSGFWYKMAKADLFDIKLFDQFVDRGYQRRVSMRGTWASIPVAAHSSRRAIIDVRIDPDAVRRALVNNITGRYRGADGWDRYGKTLVDMIEDISTNRLWQFNVELIIRVRDLLGITTPLGIAVKPEGSRSEGLVSVLSRYDQPTYLSGTGARTYMGDCREFTQAAIPVVWSQHQPVTGESIVTLLMDFEDPMAQILREHPAEDSWDAPEGLGAPGQMTDREQVGALR